MIFNDPTGLQGMIQECEQKCFGDNGYGRISGDTNLMGTFTRRINNAMDRIASLIRKSDGRWIWDDQNNTTYPIAVTQLNANQQDYVFDLSMLEITRVEILDPNGIPRLIDTISQDEIQEQAMTQFYASPGTPLYYEKRGNGIFLYPAPNYTLASALKVYFKRQPVYFTVNDTIKAPGFKSDFHIIVPWWASYEYCEEHGISAAAGLKMKLEEFEDELEEGYMKRSKDERTKISIKREVWR